jgi:uncharacterized RDD family membrane protein YckC
METPTTLSFIFSWVIPIAILLVIIAKVSAYLIKNKNGSPNMDETIGNSGFFKNKVEPKLDSLVFTTDKQTAGFIQRVVAFWIDSNLFSIPVDIIVVAMNPDETQLHIINTLFGLAFLIYKIYMESVYGQTFGKYILGIRVESMFSSVYSLTQIIKRNLFYLIYTVLTCFGIIRFVPEYKLSEIALNENENIVIATAIILTLTILADTLWYFVKDKGQTIHDIIGDTVIIKFTNRHKHFWWIIISFIVLNTIIKNLENWL